MNDFRPQRFEILPLVVKNLLILNGLMFLASVVTYLKFHVDLITYLGLYYPTSELFKPYQFVSHMFMHAYITPGTNNIYGWHIFSNMFALWMFGSVLENVWGAKRFFFFYVSCGLGGALLHLGVSGWQMQKIITAVNEYQSHPGIADFATLAARYDYLLDMYKIDQFIEAWKQHPTDPTFIGQSVSVARSFPEILANIPIVGASGAIFGVLVAFGMSFPNTYLYIYFLFPIKAKYFVIFYALFELFAGFRGAQDNVAHFAHIGGGLLGFLIVKYWNRKRRSDFF